MSARAHLLVAAICAWTACSSGGRQPAPAAAPEPVVQAVTPQPAAPAAPATAPRHPKPGFYAVKVEDAAPLCMFPSMQAWSKAKLRRDVVKQELPAKSVVVVGAYSPWCVHESCDQRPSLQCQVERQGDTLVVRSRYWGEHKDGPTCKEDCRSITAACKTPELEAGKYTVKHGAASFTLTIPSVLREPCFGAEIPPPGPGESG